jgi:NADH dehydrogenase (ubiquinone) 1 alpha subcomplex subunit 8
MTFPTVLSDESRANRFPLFDVLSISRIKDINTHCLKLFTAHWECLENNNHRMFDCRKPEVEFNDCVFEKIVCLCLPPSVLAVLENVIITLWVQGLKKVIPGSPEGQTPVHLRPKQLYSRYPGPQY